MDNEVKPYRSSVVFVGSVPLGGDYPIRIQSMTNTDTLDTEASVAQCIRIIEAGADFVRLAAQGTKEARNLENIKKELLKAGYNTPLIADIHFNPAAAEVAAEIVEKVRINPGNYVDRRSSSGKILSDSEYEEELERIHTRLLPLINICHRNNTAIRIGVNHGSLSARIIERYGNTPQGMVYSAIEFIKIFRAENFHRLVISMKSSDTSVMIEANRLLVKMMQQEGYYYPLHLGVTEAGEGEDGRVRSAAGIGTLLAEGIGDTIRVSLTEEPEKEIPVAKMLAGFLTRGVSDSRAKYTPAFRTAPLRPAPLRKVNGPIVMLNMTRYEKLNIASFREAGFTVDESKKEITGGDNTPDLIIASQVPEIIPSSACVAVPFKIWMKNRSRENLYPVFSPDTWPGRESASPDLNVIFTEPRTDISLLSKIDPSTAVLVFTYRVSVNIFAPDEFLRSLSSRKLNFSIILNPVFEHDSIEELCIKAPAVLGGYLNDRNVSGISITSLAVANSGIINSLCFSILQCTGTRITRNIYISCPTCGRTKFNLQEVLRKVKEKTSHLRGLKIAVMGCVVNGPGEMAGADWGYVGASEGKVHIYKGTEPVLKNVSENKAIDELLRLIEEDQASR
ncbi:MAG TPA: (E)-4-hydroxy-3-methylbut-2-enyl-diphosphate synthase [Bacteroidales bacterium]|nr:(E)-4-hydroxy-3-methylbut-2-enyl-diphosphate synthase [Bacteroidales bacterium]